MTIVSENVYKYIEEINTIEGANLLRRIVQFDSLLSVYFRFSEVIS